MTTIVQNYTLSQALFILSAIMLHTMVGTALFRPLSFYKSTIDSAAVLEPVELKEMQTYKPETVGKSNSQESVQFSESYTVSSQESLYFSALNLSTLRLELSFRRILSTTVLQSLE